MSKCWSTIVLQRTKERVDVDLVSGSRQITASIITADVVAMRGNRPSIVGDVRARHTGFQDGVLDLQRPAGSNAATVVVANSAVSNSAAAIERATGQASIVPAEGAVSERYVA